MPEMLHSIGWPLIIASAVLFLVARLFRQPGTSYFARIADPTPVLRWPGKQLFLIAVALSALGWLLLIVGAVARWMD